MAFIEQVNSKANVKQFTNNDLPFAPQQPVINSYYAVSTAGQASIPNLGFSIDTVNNPDVFFLFVDGKKLTLGSLNDFVFAAVAADGSSSQITFNAPLAANLNIQAYKLGLKPEVQFGMDNRFTQLYAAQASGFQGFVSQTDFIINATSTTGTPTAGTFYSTISGRASMVDLSQDLKARMAIDRVMVQQIFQIQNEFGPNGEIVWGAMNDTLGQIRFVGNWSSVNGIAGSYINSNIVNDYIEITFYGTGLNVVTQTHAAFDIRASTDGGSESGNLITSGASVIINRNYAPNQIVAAVSGLAVGVHTIKIRNNTTTGPNIHGFEILNESSSVKVNSGISYVGGQKLVNSSQSAFSYSSVATGTRGGRVLVYQAADGTIGKVFQAVNASQANLGSADHTNEEAVRTYSVREFGAGRSDDFSSLTGSTSTRAFTLDDGTTTLTCLNARINGNSFAGEGINNPSSTSDFFVLTFVGTGLDIVTSSDGTSSAENISVDGTSIGSYSYATANVPKIQKIVSGLPYGTHTVRFSQANVTNSNTVYKFIVYQPKKPTLPAGAVELADYNVMANYAASTSSLVGFIAQGVLRKMGTREDVYTGTWSGPSLDVANVIFDSGFNTQTSTAASYHEYTFFGTGFEYGSFVQNNQARNHTVSIDGSTNLTGSNPNWPSISTAFIGQGLGTITFTPSTGVIAGTSAATAGNRERLQVSGLPLGVHRVRMTWNSATDQVYSDTIDVITPIHSVKSNLIADLQNALPVGSCGISDNRKITPVKDALSATKAWAQAIGISNAPSTTSTSFVPVPDMSLTVKTSGGRLRISYNISLTGPSGAQLLTQIYVDGVAVGKAQSTGAPASGYVFVNADTVVIPVSAGAHKVDVYWLVNTGTTLSAVGTQRDLTAEEE